MINFKNNNGIQHLVRMLAGFIKLIALSIIFSVIILYFSNANSINENEVCMSRDEIKYYIKVADNCSKPSKQLNWKEIAAAEWAINNKFDTYDEEKSNQIAKSFYDDNGNIRGYKDVLGDYDISIDESFNGCSVLNQLYGYGYSLRTLKIGKNNAKDDFIDNLKSGSIDNYKKYKILPSIAISQAILESSWGESELATKYNNYYGIKADKSWKGEVATLSTNENYNDKIVAKFRSYNSSSDSIADFCNFLSKNRRYEQNGVFSATNYKEQAEALEKAGYSTAKDKEGNLIYADMLMDIIVENNLMTIDSEAQRQ